MPDAAKTPALVELGRRVRALRLDLDLSQEDLGKRARLHRNYIGGIEQGTRNLAVINLLKLADALGTRPGELVDGLPVPRSRATRKRATAKRTR